MALVKFKDLGQIGVVQDLRDSEIPDSAWTKAHNIVFRDGIAQRISGEAKVFTEPPGSVGEILFYPDPVSGTRYWLAACYNGTDTRIYKWDTIEFSDLSGAAVADPYLSDPQSNGWTSGNIAGVPYFNNGIEVPLVWLRSTADLKSTMEEVSTWPSGMTAMQVRPFNNFWVLLDITEDFLRNPSRLLWSHPAEPYAVPASFDIADPAYLAGDVVLGDTADYIMDALQLRGIFYVYKRNETWSMRPIGGQQIFKFERVFKSTGLLAPRMVVPIKGTLHFMVTNDKDIIVHDGNTRKTVADGKVRETIFNEIDEENLTHAFVATHYQQEEVWFCYPTSGFTYANKAAIYNYESGAWSFRDLNNARDMKFGIPETNPSVLNDDWDAGPDSSWEAGSQDSWGKFTNATLLSQDVIATDSDIRVPDQGVFYDTLPYSAELERTGLDLGSLDRKKEIISVYPKIQGGKVNVQVGGASTIDGEYSWTQPKVFNPGTDHKVSVRKNGRYIGIKFTDATNTGEETAEQWRVHSYDLQAIIRGVQ